VEAVSGLIPELLVSDLDASLVFWVQLLDFEVVYNRTEDRFVYLRREAVDVMLEERGRGRNWITGDLQQPFGRGINFEIESADWSAQLAKLRNKNWPLFMQPETKGYRVGGIEKSQLQFLVQDPDGYLLRLAQPLGQSALP
jgi:catechol 2,3-dioxygenase-like lactoylglutathione lyase family enzyme